MTFADKAIRFNQQLTGTGLSLPAGIRMMNPFEENKDTLRIAETFYRQYYSDDRPRRLILGINPGRFGGGLTGIPFTDPKRLKSECGIAYEGRLTHEPSSVFIYDMISAYGGPKSFYSDFYINSPCPLGFTSADSQGKEKNYNYYDSKELTHVVTPYMIENIWKLVGMGVQREIAYCLGTGKNSQFLNKLNAEHHFFQKIVALEHPRFIMQYKSREKQAYIDKYLTAFETVQ